MEILKKTEIALVRFSKIWGLKPVAASALLQILTTPEQRMEMIRWMVEEEMNKPSLQTIMAKAHEIENSQIYQLLGL